MAHTPELESGSPPQPSGDPAPGDDPAADPGADLGRRRFFRQFAGELIQGAASVVGAAQVLQRASAEAASAILEGDPDALREDTAVPAPPSGFRSAFRMEGNTLLLIDQRRLPDALVEHPCESAAAVAHAIRQMIIRGAPAIGQAAAIGLALTAYKVRNTKPYARRATLRGASNALVNARPTAVNLRWAVERVMARYEELGELSDDGDAIAAAMRAEADQIVLEATTDHGRLAEFGLGALPTPVDRPLNILTHCNTGPLACGQFGTALGVVQVAHHAGREIHVWVDETRPYLQGARLTAWELQQAGVPHTLIPDVAAGSLMQAGEVDVVLVGADHRSPRRKDLRHVSGHGADQHTRTSCGLRGVVRSAPLRRCARQPARPVREGGRNGCGEVAGPGCRGRARRRPRALRGRVVGCAAGG